MSMDTLAKKFTEEIEKMAANREDNSGLTWRPKKLLKDAEASGMSPLELVRARRQKAMLKRMKVKPEEVRRTVVRPTLSKEEVARTQAERAKADASTKAKALADKASKEKIKAHSKLIKDEAARLRAGRAPQKKVSNLGVSLKPMAKQTAKSVKDTASSMADKVRYAITGKN